MGQDAALGLGYRQGRVYVGQARLAGLDGLVGPGFGLSGPGFLGTGRLAAAGAFGGVGAE